MTRGDFEEYKEWAEAQILKANTLALETASASWHQERELEKERALRIKAERAIETEQEMSPEELKHWARQNRGNIRIPTFRADEDDERREAEKGQFLYDDHSFHVKELTISVLLLRAQVAVKGKDVHRTSQFVFEAQRLALEFNFPPLEAKCLYWKGRAEARLGYTAAAVDTFTQALPCEGIYREGQDVRSRIDRARKAARGDPTTPKSAKTPRGRSKRQSYTGRGEHPPQFDFEGEDEAEDDDPETGAGQEREEIDSAMQTMKISGNNPPHGRRRRPSKVDFKDQGKQGGKGQKVHEKKTPARPSNVSQNF